MSTPLPSSPFAAVARVWEPTAYAHPTALASPTAISRAQQLASTLLPQQLLYVYDHRAKHTSFVSPGVAPLLGYAATDFTTEFHYAQISVAQVGVVAEATRLVNRYVLAHREDPLLGLVFSLNYQLRHADGSSRHILRQSFLLEREPNGALVAAAAVLTDITDESAPWAVQFHVNRPDFAAFMRQEQAQALPPTVSTREREIALLGLDGLSKAQISEHLSLSPNAIETHQRAVAHKMGLPYYRLRQHLNAVGPEAYLGADHAALVGNNADLAAFLARSVMPR